MSIKTKMLFNAYLFAAIAIWLATNEIQMSLADDLRALLRIEIRPM
jgi:hypothetical protein